MQQNQNTHTIHLHDGSTVEAEVNGLSLDGQSGFVFLPAVAPDLQTMLTQGRELAVVQQPEGSWKEQG